MRVRYSPRALTQLDEIFAYVASDNPAAAKRLVGRIEQIVKLLSQFPLMGRQADRQDVRIFGVPGYPYVIFYQSSSRAR